jgi:hypothetical protein
VEEDNERRGNQESDPWSTRLSHTQLSEWMVFMINLWNFTYVALIKVLEYDICNNCYTFRLRNQNRIRTWGL